MTYKCPKHHCGLRHLDNLQLFVDLHGCMKLFTLIDNNLCILEGNRWKDVKTEEYREAKAETPE